MGYIQEEKEKGMELIPNQNMAMERGSDEEVDSENGGNLCV